MINASFHLPITHIGEPNWVSKLQSSLAQYDIPNQGETIENIEQAEKTLEIELPKDIKEYCLHFGKTSTDDFMYNLKPVTEFKRLYATNWSFISLNFRMSEIDTMVVFSESPGNDPLCFDFRTGAIYLFSHDPIKKAKVFDNFSQYLVYELIEVEKLLGDPLDDSAMSQLEEQYLAGKNIDYDFRRMKLLS